MLEGVKTLQIGDELVEVRAGEMLQVAPTVRHALYSCRAPYRGLSFRVPPLQDEVTCEVQAGDLRPRPVGVCI